ncbi:peroxiredoxin [Mesonia hippocampi]|uniref:Peroxiredoxin n=1 Tax=Mesonia hippocampi TaxID=1628250 RepID=A0A840EU37_9FLAO|nr:thioredoxin family protein [Mesonia hippocampi]MBB4118976.1 peroxiredoxin [Mesonia hippocampi]
MKTFVTLSIVALLLLVSVISFGDIFSNRSYSNALKGGYKIGEQVTDFNLLNVDGNYVSLADYPAAKGFIIVFTTNHCPYAKAYEARIANLDKKYKLQGYPVIAINANSPDIIAENNFTNMKVRAQQKAFTYPYLFDKNQEVCKAFGASKTPHTYLLCKENKKLVVKYIGAIDDNYKDAKQVQQKFLEEAIQALLHGEEIAIKTTKAIGCSIK